MDRDTATRLDKRLADIIAQASQRGMLNQREQDGEVLINDGGIARQQVELVKELKSLFKTEVGLFGRELISLTEDQEVRNAQELLVMLYEQDND